ncbi:LysE family translocator [Pseudovibrio sp. Tun.PSC04-5.I4]|uniref:LysE family translocator n=1 Tax=Pseudovibrio sp. Tun.PSC04-5.I4 TaxID=1798213 RepID=UPI00088D340B|nr:LysE family translocator [Pseudovibrio sp. Tun.PSC04-5.I4]SDQ76412.1 Threonine/homoserine/homoserine lactone efflux protein [Pseudovibrio sp. Tun.PSC04-5.I4]
MELLTSFDATLVFGFIVTFMALNFTPGPAVLKVVGDSMSNGIGKTHASMAGVFGANLMYALLAAGGMSALLLSFPILFETVKWIGVAYLLYLAYGSFKAAFTASLGEAKEHKPASALRLFFTSFAMQGANPKSVLSFSAMLPVFAGEGDGMALRMMVLALFNIALEYPALLFYAYLGTRAQKFAVSARSRAAMDAFAGTALTGAAYMISRSSLKAQ